MTDDLIARLGAATEGSRELECLIARAAGWHRVEPRHGGGKYGGWIAPQDFIGVMSDGEPILDGLHGTTIARDPPRVTRSLDAVLTLAGDQWLMALQKAILGLKPYMAHPPREWPTRAARSEALRKRFILDVCAEALKARAAEEKSDA